MSLIVGTDSYVSVADAAIYCAAQGLDALSDPETLLKRATVAIDRLYGGRFIARKIATAQLLGWPRSEGYSFSADENGYFYFIDSDGNPRNTQIIPPEVVQATIELAVVLDRGEIDPYAQPNPMVKSEDIQVDVIKTTRSFAAPSGYASDPLYIITLILRPVLKNGGYIKFVR
jgi:hypothetical protein